MSYFLNGAEKLLGAAGIKNPSDSTNRLVRRQWVSAQLSSPHLAAASDDWSDFNIHNRLNLALKCDPPLRVSVISSTPSCMDSSQEAHPPANLPSSGRSDFQQNYSLPLVKGEAGALGNCCYSGGVLCALISCECHLPILRNPNGARTTRT